MDYEKKYKEALERARDFKNGEIERELEIGENIMEYIFPELKEYEDEVVIKALINLVATCCINQEEKNRLLAWLEKQGEQKPFDYENANIQQKDFAPKDSYAIKENGSPYPTKSAVVFGAKNPTWSKKDEMNLEDSMRAIKCSNYFDFESAKENVLNWLKSLKERIGG